MVVRPIFYTPNEVAIHNTIEDLWVSFLGKVYNLTPLCEKYKGEFFVTVRSILRKVRGTISDFVAVIVIRLKPSNMITLQPLFAIFIRQMKCYYELLNHKLLVSKRNMSDVFSSYFDYMAQFVRLEVDPVVVANYQ